MAGRLFEGRRDKCLRQSRRGVGLGRNGAARRQHGGRDGYETDYAEDHRDPVQASGADLFGKHAAEAHAEDRRQAHRHGAEEALGRGRGVPRAMDRHESDAARRPSADTPAINPASGRRALDAGKRS